MKFRPPAVPLVTVDPYFSIWSFADNLSEDHTRHWTGQRHGMLGMVKIDGRTYRFMGKLNPFDERYSPEPAALLQTNLEITPLFTKYTFENDIITLRLSFLTPLLLNKPELASRPASYVYYSITINDGRSHDITVYFDISSEMSVNLPSQQIKFGKTDYSVYCGNTEQSPLNKSGDNIRIDWGYLHLAHKNARALEFISRYNFIKNSELKDADFDKPYTAMTDYPVIAVISSSLSDVICIAYDDIKSIEYFGSPIDAYYKTYYKTFDNMVKCALEDFKEVKAESEKFCIQIKADTDKVNKYYSDITALTYRQTIAAHKTAADSEGNMLFLSKECFSNGCIATLDVTYPSIPLYIKYNPEYVKGMLIPILKYAVSDAWTFDFAPHDCGQYPLCNGQVYGENRLEMQMPVEECGNMLLCTAAVCHAEGNTSFAEKYKDILTVWADYLMKSGYDPGNQLCTDDFAGHLAHNCNLSVKAILGIAAYGDIFNNANYTNEAKRLAAQWSIDAKNKKATALTFDKPDSWSLKYNLVWDKILGYNIFDESIYENETALYKEKINKYGVPLDSRADYTKTDWLAWTTVLTNDKNYAYLAYKAIWDSLNETCVRVPATDWYDTKTADQVYYFGENIFKGFQNRTVMGGLFINLLTM